MTDLFIPGGMTCFTYLDTDVEKRKPAYQWSFPSFWKGYLTIINRFKNAYEDIKVNEITSIDCIIEDTNCRVNGKYDIILVSVPEEINLKEKWFVEFEFDGFGFWEINHVQIEGINF